jgi:hypothetical protein
VNSTYYSPNYISNSSWTDALNTMTPEEFYLLNATILQPILSNFMNGTNYEVAQTYLKNGKVSYSSHVLVFILHTI